MSTDMYGDGFIEYMIKLRDDGVIKTWREWNEELEDIRILDPDGFRDMRGGTLYTKEEFDKRLMLCTIVPKDWFNE